MIFFKNQSQLYHVTFLLTTCQWLPIVLGIWPCLTLQLPHALTDLQLLSSPAYTTNSSLATGPFHMCLPFFRKLFQLTPSITGLATLLLAHYKCHFFNLPTNHNSLSSPHFHSTSFFTSLLPVLTAFIAFVLIYNCHCAASSCVLPID